MATETSDAVYKYRLAESKRLIAMAIVDIERTLTVVSVGNDHIDAQELFEAITHLGAAKAKLQQRLQQIDEIDLPS